MQKTVHSPEYRAFLKLLRSERKRRGLSQAELAQKIGQTQSFVSKCERGERRIDVIELRAICRGLGIDFRKFVGAIEREP